MLQRYAFRVTTKEGRFGYVKTDKDISKVSSDTSESSTIELYASESDNKTMSVNKKDIVEFVFGTYSAKTIPNDFLRNCTSLTSPPIIPVSVTSIGSYFLYGCTSLTSQPVIGGSVRRV